MNCRTVQAKLSERLGALLTTDERAQIDAHLSRCAACQNTDRALRLAVTSLQELPESKVSPDFMARLRSSLPEERLPAWKVWFRSQFGFGVTYVGRRIALAGATAALLLSTTAGVMQMKQEQAQRAEEQASAYLALCEERHDLYANAAVELSNDNNEERAPVW